ncbi:MAG: hypothetical protein JRD04_05675 [Deltaproteobacteria bacterium]|nr:hypothetical protein [Deltaproteobacteria bacterium]
MKNKIKEWIRRYLPADILSTVLSLATAWLIHRETGDNVLAAFVGSAMASISTASLPMGAALLDYAKKS